jgi:hypothetical protein
MHGSGNLGVHPLSGTRTSDLCAHRTIEWQSAVLRILEVSKTTVYRHLQYVTLTCAYAPGFQTSPAILRANASQMLLSMAAVVCTDTDIQPTAKEPSPADGPENLVLPRSGGPGLHDADGASRVDDSDKPETGSVEQVA